METTLGLELLELHTAILKMVGNGSNRKIWDERYYSVNVFPLTWKIL